MTKQEEIREGIAKITGNRPNPREIDYETADIVMGFLASVGVVIEVVPDNSPQIFRAVESLI